MRRKHGFTLIELLVVIGIITLLVGILLPALARARATAAQVKDGTQVSQIHKGWITFAQQFKGRFPTPGVVLTLTPQDPGRGDEDRTANTTAALHSLCIMENYYSAEICISTSEPNGNVIAKTDYNFAMHSPVEGRYWDDNEDPESGFQADITRNGDFTGISNVSYASMPIAGTRRSRQWRESLDSTFPIISNRGPENGAEMTDTQPPDPDIYNASLTLDIHGSSRQWVGNVCYNDNHVDVARSFIPDNVNFIDDSGESLGDNIFRNDTGADGETGDGRDAYLTFVIEMGDDTLEPSLTTAWD